jgi:hypothetical protein
VIAFKNVAEILDKSLTWEQELKDLYDVAEFAMKSDESRKTVALLRDNLEKKLAVLKKVDPADHGSAEWVRYAADYNDKDLINAESITRDSAPEEILSHIVTYQERLRDFYGRIAENLVSRDQRELFESLAAFKSEQIEEFGLIMSRNR